MSMSTEAPLTGTEFEALLALLETCIAAAATRGVADPYRKNLKAALFKASVAYQEVRRSADTAAQSTFHQIDLQDEIQRFNNEADREAILIALGAPASTTLPLTWPQSDRAAVELAWDRYKSMMRSLADVDRAVPPAPAPRGKGRPTETADLRAAVQVLVDHWEQVTGKPFAADWEKGNDAARFLIAAIRIVAPGRARSLRRLTAELTRERKRAAAKS
jgi:hypothetical protein